MCSLLCAVQSFLLNNLLKFTTSYLTINPVVRCVPPVSLSSKCRGKNRFRTSCFLLSCASNLEYTCRH